MDGFEWIRLGRRELEIMHVVWDRGEVTVQEVCDQMPHRPAYTTVLSIMRNLEQKGALRHRVEGRSYVYEAGVSREQVQVSMLKDLTNSVFGGSPLLLLNCLVSQNPPTGVELDEFRRLSDVLDSGGST